MDAPKNEYHYVVIAPEGTGLRRESTLNSMTQDRKENVIRTLPLGTRIAIKSAIFPGEGHSWILGKSEIGNQGEVGWIDFDGLMGQRNYIVTVQEGTDLRREPTHKSSTEGGKGNVILSLPLGKRLIRLRNDTSSHDGHEWALVRPEIGTNQVGWADVKCLIEPGPFVITKQRTDLRREPSLKPKTQNGKDNSILSLPQRTLIILVSADVRTIEGHEWGLFSPEIGNEEVGWVYGDHIEFYQPLAQSSVPAPSTVQCSCLFDGKTTYKMYKDKVDAATGQYIFKSLPGGKEFKITESGTTTIFYTNQDNINIMKDHRIGWLT